ncbi:MAG: DUF465 domain-containing protein [Rhizobiaceae bacterium]
MSHVPHELAEEFPEHVQKLHDLKLSNQHFVKLSDEYHTLNREIHRIETGIEPTSDEHQTQLRKERMLLKDKIASILASN